MTVSRGLYFLIFAALLALTGVTIAVATLDLGPLNTLAALAIAVVKAALVVLYFMHLRWSERLTRVFFAGALGGLVVLITVTLADYLSRAWLPGSGW